VYSSSLILRAVLVLINETLMADLFLPSVTFSILVSAEEFIVYLFTLLSTCQKCMS